MPLFYYAVTRAEAWYFRPLNWRWLRQIGVWSFTIYLCHYAVILALEAHGVAMGSVAMVLVAGGGRWLMRLRCIGGWSSR